MHGFQVSKLLGPPIYSVIGKQEIFHIAVAARRAIWASPLDGRGEFRGKKAEARIVLGEEHHATISHHIYLLRFSVPR